LYLHDAFEDISDIFGSRGTRRLRRVMEQLPDSYRNVPIIALTKIPEVVEKELSQIPRVAVVAKLEGLKVGSLPTFVRDFSGDMYPARNSGTRSELID